jgi:hypothetical protein
MAHFEDSKNVDLGEQYHHLEKIENLEKYIKEIS